MADTTPLANSSPDSSTPAAPAPTPAPPAPPAPAARVSRHYVLPIAIGAAALVVGLLLGGVGGGVLGFAIGSHHDTGRGGFTTSDQNGNGRRPGSGFGSQGGNGPSGTGQSGNGQSGTGQGGGQQDTTPQAPGSTQQG